MNRIEEIGVLLELTELLRDPKLKITEAHEEHRRQFALSEAVVKQRDEANQVIGDAKKVQQQLDDLARDISKQKAEIESVRSSLDKKAAALAGKEDDLKKLDHEIDERRKAVGDREREADNLASKQAVIQQALDRREREVSAREEAVAKREARIASFSTEIRN